MQEAVRNAIDETESDKPKIHGVDRANVFIDRPEDARNKEETIIVLFEGDSDYSPDGEDVYSIGVYGTLLHVQVVAKKKSDAKRICLETAQALFIHFSSLRFRSSLFRGVQRDSKKIGLPSQNQYEDMYVATRSFILRRPFSGSVFSTRRRQPVLRRSSPSANIPSIFPNPGKSTSSRASPERRRSNSRSPVKARSRCNRKSTGAITSFISDRNKRPSWSPRRKRINKT